MAANHLKRELFKIWEEDGNRVFLNDKLSQEKRNLIEKISMEKYAQNSICLLSSGTEYSQEEGLKVIFLKKEAILHGAKSVNKTYELTKNDIWLNSLPHFHIGGLSIYARAFLSGSEVIDFFGTVTWNIKTFMEGLKKHAVTVTSLVPTQVYDLIENNEKSPSELRCVFVGGGALSEELYFRGRKLGWPLLPSYGMTETSAMVAGASMESLKREEFPKMEILPHVRLRLCDDQKFTISSAALLSGVLFVREGGAKWVPVSGEFLCDDRIGIANGQLEVLGRPSDLVKILGETVDLKKLENLVYSLSNSNGFCIVAKPDKRKGFELILVGEEDLGEDFLKKFNERVMPFERIQHFHKIDNLPRTALGKLIKQGLLEFVK